ncbi:elicitor-responsive protein 3 [Phalaenopsis equestris]|uniref:elicitor-responsive protein 3 n=1 Tax=Phalaenopsis equestris TaxID=78828 RepID=UPI0009E37A44|nr:elicitor-responsive protein 3 [Phalaenopsis equestris]
MAGCKGYSRLLWKQKFVMNIEEMSGGVLEVLLVNAEGLKHARLSGSRRHVVIECGAHTIASKFTTAEDGKAWWNEKFSFNLSHLDLKKLRRMRLRIVGQDKLFEHHHIGEATIHLMDIIKEGHHRGKIEIKPTSYNVVLEDQTYKGEIKVGLKFTSGVSPLKLVQEFIFYE